MPQENNNMDGPAPSPANPDQRKEVIKRLFKSARLMEHQMNTLFTGGHIIQAECQFQIIQGIYNRLSDQEYKYCICH